MATSETLFIKDAEELKPLPKKSFCMDTGWLVVGILFSSTCEDIVKACLTETFILCLRCFSNEKKEDKQLKDVWYRVRR